MHLVTPNSIELYTYSMSKFNEATTGNVEKGS